MNYSYLAILARIPCIPSVNTMHANLHQAHDKTSIGSYIITVVLLSRLPFFLLATFLSFSIAVLEEKVVWLARLALVFISSFSENLGVGQILFGWDKNFLKNFVLGQNSSEIFCPRTKIFILWDKNFLKIFILGHFFSRTKIPVTGHARLDR